MAHLGHLILFENANFDGNHKHVVDSISNLAAVSGGFNDKTSSLAILDGQWEFYRHIDFQDLMFAWPGGPGEFPIVPFDNDSLSSVRLTGP